VDTTPETAPVEDAFCQQAEAWTPRQEGHELAEGPTVEAGIAKQRKRSGEFHHSVGFAGSPGERADQPAPLRMADQHARVPLHLDPYDGRAEEHPLDHGEIASKCQLHRRQRRRRRRDESFAGQVPEQRLLKILSAHAQGGGDCGPDGLWKGRCARRFPEDMRSRSPGRHRRLPLAGPESPENLDGESELLRRALARQWVTQPRLQLTLRPSDEPLMLLEENPKPGVVMFPEEVRHREGSGHAIAEQIGG